MFSPNYYLSFPAIGPLKHLGKYFITAPSHVSLKQIVSELLPLLVAQLVKNPPAMQETWVRPLGWEDPLEKGKATNSSILTWRIPWTVWGREELDTTERLSLSLTHPPQPHPTPPNSSLAAWTDWPCKLIGKLICFLACWSVVFSSPVLPPEWVLVSYLLTVYPIGMYNSCGQGLSQMNLSWHPNWKGQYEIMGAII